MNFRPLFFLTLITLVLASCKKEVIEEIHQNKVVGDNVAPPYDGVTTIQIENYVNRIFIDLLGRQPSESEIQQHVQTLKNGSLDEASRESVINYVLQSPDYYKRNFEIFSIKYIEGVNESEIQDQIDLFNAIIDLYYQNGDSLIAFFIELDRDELVDLKNARPDYASGAITVNEYHKRFLLNYFYDEINMGSTNFVLACFENLFFREPTANELQQGVSMVDGGGATMFQQDGNTKLDFTEILTQSDEFYQGLVIEVFKNLISRNPTSYEMGTLTETVKNSGNFKDIQRYVLKSAEYAGF